MEKKFYYRHVNNEIYEMRFKSIVVNPSTTLKDYKAFKFWALYVSAEVASLGVLQWRYARCLENTLLLNHIFDSIEKAIRCKNNITLTSKERANGMCAEDLFKISYGFNQDCSAFAHEIVLPPHIVAENRSGNNLSFGTYVWNGVEAVFKKDIGVQYFNGKRIINSYREILYDLVSREFIYDKSSLIGYGSAEECRANNVIKVHTL